MTIPARVRRVYPVLLAVLALLAVGGDPAHAAPCSPRPAPTLIDVSAATQSPTLFTVVGEDFTPGGRVYLAIYDEMGATLYETRWVTASSDPFYGPGDSHPTQEDPGGVVRETFGLVCGATAMMRALDEETAVWSNWIPVRVACESGAGPDELGLPYQLPRSNISG